MKKLSLSSITALLGLCIIPACVLTVTDDVADDDVGTETTTTTDGGTDDATTTTDTTTDATTDATTDGTTAEDDIGTDTAAETTDGGPACGWNPDGMPAGYYCGFEGVDPGGTNPIECPEGLVEGDPCATTGLTGEGCCDAEGNNWFCAGEDLVFLEACA